MSYIGKIPATGNFVKLDAISVVNGQAGYTMQSSSVNFTPESANHMIVSLNGVIQAPLTAFTVSGSTITFASALSTGDVIDFIMVYGNVLDIGTPSDNTVTASKLTTDSVIEAKIQNDAVTRDKINAISTSSLPSFEAKGTSGVTEGYIQLNCAENSHGIKLKSPPHSASASYTLTFPTTDGNADEFLKTDGSGVLSWATAGGYVYKIDNQINTTRSVLSSSTSKTTILSGTFTNTVASSKVLVQLKMPHHGSASGAQGLGFTYNGTDYDGAITYTYEDTDNLSFSVMNKSFTNPASTGSINWVIYFKSADGSNARPFKTHNPNSTDDARLTQQETQITFMEYTA